MKAYSQDLRDRVMAVVAAGDETRAEIAATFGISVSSIDKWSQRQRLTGQYAERPHGGGRQRALASCEALLRRAWQAQPDMSLAELCEQVQRQASRVVSESMLCRELQRLNLPRKKSRSTIANVTAHGSKAYARRTSLRSNRL